MLVLSRRSEEQIVFPELGITVEVLRIKGNVVRLGIKAPDSVRILRGELHDNDIGSMGASHPTNPQSEKSQSPMQTYVA